MSHDTWEIWRAANVVIAVLAFVFCAVRGWRQRLVTHGFDTESSLGFLANMAWCAGYAIATIYANTQNVDPGPWTAIMSVPILWTFISGFIGMRRPSKR